MSYDAASFKAGFALGRMLWRPPALRGDQDTGLGWSADPSWLIYDPDIYLGRANDRYYHKQQGGWAIAFFSHQTPSLWTGPVLVSTEYSAVEEYYKNAYGQYVGYISPNDSFTYAGLTWYVNHNYRYQTNNFETGNVRYWQYEDVIDMTSWGIQILKAAKVRVHFV